MHLRIGLALIIGLVVSSGANAQTPQKPLTDMLGDPLPEGAIFRLGTMRLKHTPFLNSLITAAVFSPDGSMIASRVGASGPPIRLWQTASGKEIPGAWTTGKAFTTHVFSPDSKIIAAAVSAPEGVNNQKGVAVPVEIMLWDVAQGKPVQTLVGHPNFVGSLAFADGGKTLVSAGNGAICWWDVGSGKQKRLWRPFAEDKKPSADGRTHYNMFIYTELSADAGWLAGQFAWREIENGPAQTTAGEAEVFGLDLATGKLRWRAAEKTKDKPRFAFSGDGKRVAIALGPNRVEVRDMVNGKLIAGPVNSEFLRNSVVDALAFSSDGTTLATAGKTSHNSLWKIDDQNPKNLRRLSGRLAQNRLNSTECLAFSPDNKIILVGVDFDIQLYDFKTLKPYTPWEGHRGWVGYLHFSADGNTLFSGSSAITTYPKELASWDVATWKRQQLTSSQSPQRWPNIGIPSPEHSYFTGKTGENRLVLYDMGNAKALARLEVPPIESPESGFFSPSGKLYVLTSGSAKGKEIDRLYAVPSGKLLCELPALMSRSETDVARTVAFSSDDQLVAVIGREDGLVHIIETSTGKTRRTLGNKLENRKTELTPYLDFSPDKKLLATTNQQKTAIRVWDVETGVERLRLAHPGQSLSHFAWSADGRLLAVSQNKTIRLWELASLGVRRELDGHEGPVRALAFSPDGQLLASGSADTTILIWSLVKWQVATPGNALKRADLEKSWQVLAESDAAKTWSAIQELTASPKESVAWIKDQLKPSTPVDAKRIEELIGQLEDKQFKVREKAMEDLSKIGEQIVPAIDKVLATNPPLETRLRLQDLRSKSTAMVLKGERLQAVRAVEVLELINSPEARQLLQTLADGAPGALVTIQAEGALGRLKK